MVNWKKIVCNLITCYTAIQVAFCFSTMNTTNIYCLFYIVYRSRGRIQDYKLGGGAHNKNAPSGGRHENFCGISCEKSRFYAKKIIFFPILGGRSPPPPPLDPPLRSICLSLSISNSFPVYVHAVFHFVSPLEIHNLYFGKHNKGDKSYKFMLQVANYYAPPYEN